MLVKSQTMTKLLLTGAAATAIAGAVMTGTAATSLADPATCVDANGVECNVTAPGVEGTAGPGGVVGTAPGVDGTAGPGGVGGCVIGIGCLDIPTG